MKIRHKKTADDKIELQMTPMIDIVFQLLVFFIMTFKIVVQEGDFNIKMPLESPSAGSISDSFVAPIELRMTAQADGTLANITVTIGENDTPVGNKFGEVRKLVIEYLGDDRGPGSTAADAEVELDCDYNLNYAEVVEAITQVSGHYDKDGNLVKLVEKIKFKPQAGG